MYAKVANLIMWFNADPRYGLIYLVLVTRKYSTLKRRENSKIILLTFSYVLQCKPCSSQSLHILDQKKLFILEESLWKMNSKETRELCGLWLSTLFGALAASTLLQSSQNYLPSMIYFIPFPCPKMCVSYIFFCLLVGTR